MRATKLDSPSRAQLPAIRGRIGFDHVIDYEKEDFTKSGKRYDVILDTKTNRSPFEYMRALNPGGTYATVGGVTARALEVAIVGGWIRRTTTKKTVLIKLKQNKHLAYLSERFEAEPVGDHLALEVRGRRRRGPPRDRRVREQQRFVGKGWRRERPGEGVPRASNIRRPAGSHVISVTRS